MAQPVVNNRLKTLYSVALTVTRLKATKKPQQLHPHTNKVSTSSPCCHTAVQGSPTIHLPSRAIAQRDAEGKHVNVTGVGGTKAVTTVQAIN